jgi:Na+/melibiose symporter-like transporter
MSFSPHLGRGEAAAGQQTGERGADDYAKLTRRHHPPGDRRRPSRRVHLYALRKARPLVEIRLLAKRSVASSSAALFFSGFSLYGAMLLLPLFYQDVRGATALTAGIVLVPQGIGAALSRIVAGSNIDKFGSRLIVLGGCVIVAAATVPFAFAGPHTNSWLLAPWMIIRGFGLGAVTMPLMVAAYVGLDN